MYSYVIILSSQQGRNRCLHLEAASRFGRTWLNVIPTTSNLHLTDLEISAALTKRGIFPETPGAALCWLCRSPYDNHHSERCREMKTTRTMRHNQIQWAMVSALRTVRGVDVTREPPIEGSSSLRNDIRITSGPTAPIQDADIDLTVRFISTTGKSSPSWAIKHFTQPTDISSPASDLVTIANATMLKILARWRAEKLTRISGIEGYSRLPRFHVFPISTGGFCDPEAERMLQVWKSAMPPSSYTRLIQEISLILVRCRALGLPSM